MTDSRSLLDNIRIVLVEPQGPLNVGSVCRAMNNFGLHNLSIVRPGCELDNDAVKMAMHSTDILENAQITDNIPEAIKGSVLVLGTANRRGEYHEPNYTVKEGLERVSSVLSSGPVSILFGREEWGLTKDDLQYTMGTMRVVTDEGCTSLNLSQAVLLIAYEIYQKFGNPKPLLKACADDPLEQPATTDEIAKLYSHMENVLKMCEFLPLVNPDALFQVLRAFFHRAAPTGREVNILMGIFSNLRGFMKKYVRGK
ncbi:MAG: RNA methyltransferase [Candidatus Riflebacteria bacterium]|nr:RNA methyltransferase [Candidatus Riflebacteria bacterium]